MKKYIRLVCAYCQREFDKGFHHYKFDMQNDPDHKFYCSKKCIGDSRNKDINEKCTNCGKEIIIRNCDYKKSKSKKFFCGRSCSATYSNKHRIISEEKKQEMAKKISESLKKYYKVNDISISTSEHSSVSRYISTSECVICGSAFKRKQGRRCCSIKCGQILQFGSFPYTKDELVGKIIELATKVDRTPQKRECEIKMVSAAIRFFGTWNKAMELCGLKPNHSKYQKIRLKCSDGHMADSISEKIVDEWLTTNKIVHERSKKYPNTNYDCDFYLTEYDIWLEYFGLLGRMEEYLITAELKRKIAKENNLKFIEIIPSDLYPENKLDSFLTRIKNPI